MSVHCFTYVGPHVNCIIDRVPCCIFESGCLNDDCVRYHQRTTGRFCPECGNLLGSYALPKNKERVDCRILQVLLHDVLIDNEGSPYSYCTNRQYVPNVLRGQKQRQFEIDNRGGLNHSIFTADSIAQEMKWFEAEYAVEIAIIRETYGPDKMSIVWGVFTYIN